ncbi:hypothetical protein ACOME3_010145 [Neoechinorhynchus agilis]
MSQVELLPYHFIDTYGIPTRNGTNIAMLSATKIAFLQTNRLIIFDPTSEITKNIEFRQNISNIKSDTAMNLLVVRTQDENHRIGHSIFDFDGSLLSELVLPPDYRSVGYVIPNRIFMWEIISITPKQFFLLQWDLQSSKMETRLLLRGITRPVVHVQLHPRSNRRLLVAYGSNKIKVFYINEDDATCESTIEVDILRVTLARWITPEFVLVSGNSSWCLVSLKKNGVIWKRRLGDADAVYLAESKGFFFCLNRDHSLFVLQLNSHYGKFEIVWNAYLTAYFDVSEVKAIYVLS